MNSFGHVLRDTISTHPLLKFENKERETRSSKNYTRRLILMKHESAFGDVKVFNGRSTKLNSASLFAGKTLGDPRPLTSTADARALKILVNGICESI